MQFLEHYGEERGSQMWDEAAGASEAEPASPADAADEWEARAVAAREKMDAGLQAAFDDIPQETRRSMEQFADNHRAGAKLKLPHTLSAKQRKAVHLWAEMQRCEHLSFGYRGRRRLWLSIGDITADEAAPAGEDAWSDEEGSDSYDDED